MRVRPYFVGSGTSSQAMKEAWAILGLIRPELDIQSAVQIKRGESLGDHLIQDDCIPVLCVCNPHGLHAQTIQAGEKAGYKLIIAEKPACVSLNEVIVLKNVNTPVAVCHVYRQHWGVQTIRQMVDSGELGNIIAVEGRYWQSSTAQRVAGLIKGGGWKNDPALSGPYDTLLDVGVHWVDAALFILKADPVRTSLWLSHANSEASHRDSHVQLLMQCSNESRLFASISKTFHGAPNHFEINVIGTKKSATWKFLEPDQIEIGCGNTRTLHARPRSDGSAIHPPYHGLGWLEGYVEVFNAALKEFCGQSDVSYPKLSEHLNVIEALLSADGVRS
jgi:predicted dehydrogenase